MKKVATAIIAIFLLALTASADNVTDVSGTLQIRKNSIVSEPVTATTEDITLYVRTTGADTNDGLTVGTALRQPQEAADRIPRRIEHDVTIDIGEGNFDGVALKSFILASSASFLRLNGTLGDFSPATGKQTGTATGGSTTQCVDAAGGWTDHDLRGTLVHVGSEWRVVRDNDGTTIDLVGPLGGTCSGEVYAVEEQKTVITSAASPGTGGIEIAGGINSQKTNQLIIQDIKVSGVSGVYLRVGMGLSIARLATVGGSYGVMIQHTTSGRLTMYDCFSTNNYYGFFIGNSPVSLYRTDNIRIFAYANTDHGFALGYLSGIAEMDYTYADANGGAGVFVESSGFVGFAHYYARNNTKAGIELSGGVLHFYLQNGTIEDNGTYGVVVDSSTRAQSFLRATGTIVIQNNTLGGIIAENHSIVALSACTGTNTGAYGLTLETGSYATITTATAITGATGDATINGGTTNLTWATDFAADGDMVINLDSGSRIERKD